MKHEAWAQDLRSSDRARRRSTGRPRGVRRSSSGRRRFPGGIVARGDADRLWERHIRDSLRALPELPPEARIADLGSGAGLPGLPLAIAAPSCSFSLIETTSRPRGLPGVGGATVSAFATSTFSSARPSLGRQVVSTSCLARAFASPVGSWAAASPMLEDAGSLIYWAGSRLQGGRTGRIGRLPGEFPPARALRTPDPWLSWAGSEQAFFRAPLRRPLVPVRAWRSHALARRSSQSPWCRTPPVPPGSSRSRTRRAGSASPRPR